MLQSPGSRERQARKQMAGTGNRFQVIPDSSLNWVKFQNEPLLAFFGVKGGRGVQKPELCGRIDRLHNPAEMERPESKRMDLDRNDLAVSDGDFRVRDPHPAQIEFRPFREGAPCRREHVRSVADSSAETIVGKAKRQFLAGNSVPQRKQTPGGARNLAGRPDGALDFARIRFFEPKHDLQYRAWVWPNLTGLGWPPSRALPLEKQKWSSCMSRPFSRTKALAHRINQSERVLVGNGNPNIMRHSEACQPAVQ
jgi:hypothetical protein